MHRYHPVNKDDLEAILFDDCDDCERKSTDPVALLDTNTVFKLWTRMYEVEMTGEDSYRSGAERVACGHLWETWIFLRRHLNMSVDQIEELTNRRHSERHA